MTDLEHRLAAAAPAVNSSGAIAAAYTAGHRDAAGSSRLWQLATAASLAACVAVGTVSMLQPSNRPGAVAAVELVSSPAPTAVAAEAPALAQPSNIAFAWYDAVSGEDGIDLERLPSTARGFGPGPNVGEPVPGSG